jgi:hypothetical protein
MLDCMVVRLRGEASVANRRRMGFENLIRVIGSELVSSCREGLIYMFVVDSTHQG